LGDCIMLEVDARGMSCPIPVMKTKKALQDNPAECCVLVDAYVQVENVSRFAKARGYEVKNVEEDGETYRIIVTRKETGDA